MSSPRMRRLAADYQAIRNLCRDSSILDVSCSGDPPTVYLLKFHGQGLAFEAGRGVFLQQEHSVRVRLGSSYPRQIPELHWLTPIFHPNISANGLVCLGGYTTNWVPSLKMDDLCLMLWDMIRYRNFDPGSPYNRQAAEWARTQREFILPLDSRPLRDRSHPDPGPDPRVLSHSEMEKIASNESDHSQGQVEAQVVEHQNAGQQNTGHDGVELVSDPYRPAGTKPEDDRPDILFID